MSLFLLPKKKDALSVKALETFKLLAVAVGPLNSLITVDKVLRADQEMARASEKYWLNTPTTTKIR